MTKVAAPPRAVRLADVAREAGVSQGTASNVFNKPDLVRETVRARVMEAAKRLNYSGPDPRGRLLRAGKVDAIGVVVSEELAHFFADPYARRFMAGIAEACDADGSSLLLISAGSTRSGRDGIRNALVDGFIVCSLEDGAHLLGPVRDRRLPYVSVDFDGGSGSVRIDDRGAARRLAASVLALGHRRFGVLSFVSPDGPQDVSAVRRVAVEDALRARFSVKRDRLTGYVDALREGGVAPETATLVETPNVRRIAALAAERLLDEAPDITAILAMSDVMALGALDAAAARGLRVPDDLSVTGFDGLPSSRRASPPLTTMRQPMKEKGARAARMLFKGEAERLVLDVEFVPGDSAGAPTR